MHQQAKRPKLTHTESSYINNQDIESEPIITIVPAASRNRHAPKLDTLPNEIQHIIYRYTLLSNGVCLGYHSGSCIPDSLLCFEPGWSLMVVSKLVRANVLAAMKTYTYEKWQVAIKAMRKISSAHGYPNLGYVFLQLDLEAYGKAMQRLRFPKPKYQLGDI